MPAFAKGQGRLKCQKRRISFRRKKLPRLRFYFTWPSTMGGVNACKAGAVIGELKAKYRPQVGSRKLNLYIDLRLEV